jgi:PAS domain S-box-containing protein
MFWIGCRWIGPSLFSHAVYGYDELDDGRVRMTVEIPDHYRPSEAFFRITLGALRTTPLAAGYSTPAVVSLDTDGRRAEFMIEPPPRPSFWSMLRRLIKLPFAASDAIEELSEQQEALNRSVRELSAAQQRIGERELQLDALDALGRQLVHEIETQRVGDGLLESLRARFGWNGAALWIEGRGAQSELELLCHSGGDAGPARAHLLRAGGRVVGRLDVWGGDRGDDPVRREVFEKMLPWIAMAVSSARERSGGAPRSEFRWTGESGKDLFLIVDAEGGIRYASPTIETLLGISPDEAVALGITGLVHPEDWPALEHTFATSLIGPGSAAFSQARARHADGTWRVLEGVGIKVLDEHRRDVYLLACSDITDRQRTH